MSRMAGIGPSFVLNTRLATVMFALLKQHVSVVLAFKLSSKASKSEKSCKTRESIKIPDCYLETQTNPEQVIM